MRLFILILIFLSLLFGTIVYQLFSNDDDLFDSTNDIVTTTPVENKHNKKKIVKDFELVKNKNINQQLSSAFRKIIKHQETTISENNKKELSFKETVNNISLLLKKEQNKFESSFYKLDKDKKKKNLQQIKLELNRQKFLLQQVKDANDFKYAEILEEKIMYNEYRLDMAIQIIEETVNDN